MKFTLAAMTLATLTACAKSDAPSMPHLTPAAFEIAFSGGVLSLPDGRSFRFETQGIGRLKCPSGRIGAIEPFAVQKLNPFTVSVPPGEYPVSVAITEDVPKDRRIAYAKVTFREQRADYWQLAIPTGFDVSKLKPGFIVGYPVDGGVGSFMDETTAAYLATLNENQGFYAELERKFKESPLMGVLPAGSGNVAVFSTGIGDGRYPSYFGFNAAGEPVALITDFLMVPTK